MGVLMVMFELMMSLPVLGFEIPMSLPVLGFEIPMSFPMRFVQLSVKPTVLPLCHRAFMPRFMCISQILMLFSVSCLDIPMLFTVFCIEVLMLSTVLSVFVTSKA
jgi:hypothetical protein